MIGATDLFHPSPAPHLKTSQDPNESSVDNLNNVRRETSRHFMYKKKEYLKAKIDELDQKYQRLV